MHTISEYSTGDELRSRSVEISRTVEYLKIERLQLERNAPMMDSTAYWNRKSLLESLADWYDAESREINEALGQLN